MKKLNFVEKYLTRCACISFAWSKVKTGSRYPDNCNQVPDF